MWVYEKVNSVHIEAASVCNAACGFCPRHKEKGSTELNPYIEPQFITFENFKKFFPLSFMSQIKLWTFSGVNGDACTNPEIIQIVDYIIMNSNATIEMNTNGGMRNISFWSSLGEVMAKRKTNVMTFSIDGLEDTNHLYRRNVNWKKLISNVQAYLATGATAYWDFLIFKHNKHQVNAAKQLSEVMGFKKFFSKNANGMQEGNIDMGGYYLEPSDDITRSPSLPYLGQAEDLDYSLYKDKLENFLVNEPGEINCFSMRDGVEIMITADGKVHPCCHIAAFEVLHFRSAQPARIQVLDILKDKMLSLHDRTLEDILNNDPFGWFVDSWEKKKSLACWFTCGKGPQKTPLMQQIFGQGNYGKT